MNEAYDSDPTQDHLAARPTRDNPTPQPSPIANKMINENTFSVITDMIEIYAEYGITTFDGFVRQIHANMPEIWEYTKPYLHGIWTTAAVENPSLEELNCAQAAGVIQAVDEGITAPAKPHANAAAAAVGEPPPPVPLSEKQTTSGGYDAIGEDTREVITGMLIEFTESDITTFDGYARQIHAIMPQFWERIKCSLHGIWTTAAAVNPNLEEVTRAQAAGVIQAVETEARSSATSPVSDAAATAGEQDAKPKAAGIAESGKTASATTHLTDAPPPAPLSDSQTAPLSEYQREEPPSPKEGLNDAEAKVQADLIDFVYNHTSKARVKYEALDTPEVNSYGGKVVATNTARYLLDAFHGFRQARLDNCPPTARGAAWFARDYLMFRLAHPPPPKAGETRPLILFNSGGTASGKSRSIQPQMFEAVALVYDGQMIDAALAIRQIDFALAYGWHVVVLHTFRPFELAVNSALDRVSYGEGIWGSIHELPILHPVARASFLEVARHYAGNPHVEAKVWLNNGTTGNPIARKEIPIWEIDQGDPFPYPIFPKQSPGNRLFKLMRKANWDADCRAAGLPEDTPMRFRGVDGPADPTPAPEPAQPPAPLPAAAGQTVAGGDTNQSHAAYFNAHRKDLEAQGANVDEWNRASKGQKLPVRAKVKPRPPHERQSVQN